MTEEEQDRVLANIIHWINEADITIKTTSETVKKMMVLIDEMVADVKEMLKNSETVVKLLEEDDDPE